MRLVTLWIHAHSKRLYFKTFVRQNSILAGFFFHIPLWKIGRRSRYGLEIESRAYVVVISVKLLNNPKAFSLECRIGLGRKIQVLPIIIFMAKVFERLKIRTQFLLQSLNICNRFFVCVSKGLTASEVDKQIAFCLLRTRCVATDVFLRKHAVLSWTE